LGADDELGGGAGGASGFLGAESIFFTVLGGDFCAETVFDADFAVFLGAFLGAAVFFTVFTGVFLGEVAFFTVVFLPGAVFFTDADFFAVEVFFAAVVFLTSVAFFSSDGFFTAVFFRDDAVTDFFTVFTRADEVFFVLF
jgi:hypothetical protein